MKYQQVADFFSRYLYIFICIAFFIAFSTLAIVRYNHFGALGYDLGINDQMVWRYSQFSAPVATVGPFPTLPKFVVHIESVYVLAAPFYWIWSDARMLLLLQAGSIALGGIALYKLARKKVTVTVSIAVLICYFMFYGIQNALWSDVHSATFAAGLLAWLVYLLEKKRVWLTLVVFVLFITAKENMGIIALAVSGVYFLRRKKKFYVFLIAASVAYLFFVYYIYFPHIVQVEYLFDNKEGLFSGLSLANFYNTVEKRDVLIYSLGSFGFLPLLYPFTLIPAVADLATYFILASELKASHGIFMHYRVTLAPLMTWATILTIAKYKFLNNKYIAAYLLMCALIVQYLLHLPLSYLSKQWFWREPESVKNIEKVIEYLPENAKVAAQNNISPHITHRDHIYTLWPDLKKFENETLCGEQTCRWIRWEGEADYVIVDTSPEWDIRHFLAVREEYIEGLENAEKYGYITEFKRSGNSVLYKVEGEKVNN